MSYFNSSVDDILEGANVEYVKEDYAGDTKKYIDSILKNVDNEGAKKFLEGLKKFVEDNDFLTPAQLKGLAQFHEGNPNKEK